MKYRSEIDGLRALAVISVVIFHFFPLLLPSGYFGKKDVMYFADSQHLSKQALDLLKETNFKVRKKIISLNKLKNFTY
jgi:hypothetical protein